MQLLGGGSGVQLLDLTLTRLLFLFVIFLLYGGDGRGLEKYCLSFLLIMNELVLAWGFSLGSLAGEAHQYYLSRYVILQLCRY